VIDSLRLAVSGPGGRALLWRHWKLRLLLAAFTVVILALAEGEGDSSGLMGAMTGGPPG
jgi:hypothetical protein